MPRSMKEVMDHADELAAEFEAMEYEAGDEIPIAEYRLRRAVIALGAAEREVDVAVSGARRDGMSWAKIGAALGTSPQAAHKRFGQVRDEVRPPDERATAEPRRATGRVRSR